MRKAIAPLTRSELMKRVKSKDSAAELSLRSALHALGMRFRLHRRIERSTPDIVFVSPRLAIFVDGCFWHGCPVHATFPKTNQAYWLPKLAENRARDVRTTSRLEAAGWKVLRIWEHDCLPPSKQILRQIASLARGKPLNQRRARS